MRYPVFNEKSIELSHHVAISQFNFIDCITMYVKEATKLLFRTFFYQNFSLAFKNTVLYNTGHFL